MLSLLWVGAKQTMAGHRWVDSLPDDVSCGKMCSPVIVCYIDLIRIGVYIGVHGVGRDLEYKERYLES
jgi:hypothetical protein